MDYIVFLFLFGTQNRQKGGRVAVLQARPLEGFEVVLGEWEWEGLEGGR